MTYSHFPPFLFFYSPMLSKKSISSPRIATLYTGPARHGLRNRFSGQLHDTAAGLGLEFRSHSSGSFPTQKRGLDQRPQRTHPSIGRGGDGHQSSADSDPDSSDTATARFARDAAPRTRGTRNCGSPCTRHNGNQTTGTSSSCRVRRETFGKNCRSGLQIVSGRSTPSPCPRRSLSTVLSFALPTCNYPGRTSSLGSCPGQTMWCRPDTQVGRRVAFA